MQKMLFAAARKSSLRRIEFRRWPHASIMLDEIKYLLSVRAERWGRCAAGTTTCCLAPVAGRLPVGAGRICPLMSKTRYWITRRSAGSIAQPAESRAVGGRPDRGDPGGRGAPPGQPGGGERGTSAATASSRRRRGRCFNVNTLQHLPDRFAVMTRLGVARLAFNEPGVERREIS